MPDRAADTKPRADPSAPDRAHDPVVAPILVVDDNPAKLLAIEASLAPLHQQIVKASSGRQALHHLLEGDFATVILDVHMPDLDGFETAQMIRSRARSASTPIIFVSAVNIDETDANRGYSLGAVDYICAPIDPHVLRAKVSVFVELHRKTQEARLHAESLRQQAVELERSQRELRLSERMASIGTLCAGLGHDMGNLLLPVSVWLDSIEASDAHNGLAENIDGLRACIQYLRRLASGLRLMALDPAKELGDASVDLAKWIEEVSPVLRNAVPRGVLLESELASDLPVVRVAPHRLAQAVFNLVQNAGEVLQSRTQGRVRVWARAAEDGRSVRVGVSDNGPGMSSQVLEHCLDPFFTTKTRGISTGLGLSLVNGIVRAVGSRLEIETTDAGTTFSFVLQTVPDQQYTMATAFITISCPRVRSLAATMARSTGCVVRFEIEQACDGPAVWITDPDAEIAARAREFASRSDQRQVIIVVDDATIPDAETDPTIAARTTPGGLAARLRAFRSSMASVRDSASAPAAAVT